MCIGVCSQFILTGRFLQYSLFWEAEGLLLGAHCGALEDPLSDILQAAYMQWSHAALFLLPYSGPLSGTELFSVEPVEFTEYLV